MAIYKIIDDVTDEVVNMVVWDGGPEWSPPEGTHAELVDEEPAS